jgi:hypothetical protein
MAATLKQLYNEEGTLSIFFCIILYSFFHCHCLEEKAQQTEDGGLVIDPALSQRMQGTIYQDPNAVPIGAPLVSNIPALDQGRQVLNQVYSGLFRSPKLDPNHVFVSKILDGCVLPPPVLTPDEFMRPRSAHLDQQAAHRMVRHGTGRGTYAPFCTLVCIYLTALLYRPQRTIALYALQTGSALQTHLPSRRRRCIFRWPSVPVTQLQTGGLVRICVPPPSFNWLRSWPVPFFCTCLNTPSIGAIY